LHGTRVDVADEALGHAVNVPTERSVQVGHQKTFRQSKGKRADSAKFAIGGRRQTVQAPETFMERGKRFEADREGKVGDWRVVCHEAVFSGVESCAEEQIGGGRVIVLTKKLESARGAESGAPDNGMGGGKRGGIRADFADERLDGLAHGIGATGEIVGVAFLARAQAEFAGGFAAREETDVFGLGFARLARGEAIDASGEHAGEEAAIVGGVAGEHAGIHGGLSHSHSRR
jgi:hypothetical protein